MSICLIGYTFIDIWYFDKSIMKIVYLILFIYKKKKEKRKKKKAQIKLKSFFF